MRPIISSAAVVALGLAASTALATPTGKTPPSGATMHLDKSFSIALDNQCRYNARVRGDVTPTNPRSAASGGRHPEGALKSSTRDEELVVPDLLINADLQCANEATLLIPRRVKGTRPMTWAELERTIEDRAVLTSAEGRDACEYAPELNLSDAGLNLRAVAYRCPVGPSMG